MVHHYQGYAISGSGKLFHVSQSLLSIIFKAMLFQGQHGVIPFQNSIGPNNGQYPNQNFNSEFEGIQFVQLLLIHSSITISSRSEYDADEVDYPAPEVDYPYQVGNQVDYIFL